MDIQQKPQLIGEHIELRRTRGGEQKAYIAGTRIGVDTIYVCHELQGMTPEVILEAYPHLSLARIHAALTYYFDHPEEIRDQLRQQHEFADELERQQGATKFSRLRDALFGVKGGENGDPASS